MATERIERVRKTRKIMAALGICVVLFPIRKLIVGVKKIRL